MLRILLLLCLLCALLPAGAMTAKVNEQELVATSDLVILGTVKEDVRLVNGKDQNTGQTVISVQRMLRGSPMETVTVRHPFPQQRQVLGDTMVMIEDTGAFTLEPGEQHIFFLTRERNGYSILGGVQGIKEPEELEKYTAMLAAPAVTVTLAQPLKSIYFGQPFEVKLTVQNKTKSAWTIYPPRLLGYFYSTLLDPYLNINPPTTEEKSPTWRVNPGSEVTLSETFTYTSPPGWKAFAAESYMLTPAAVRVQVYLASTVTRTIGYPIVTSWQKVLVGYPPPAESQKE